MNCFQFDYFCGYHTASLLQMNFLCELWIAFNLITFVDITQLILSLSPEPISCELLSIWLLLWISHSNPFFLAPKYFVVNCFQFDYFCGYHTAKIWWIYTLRWLWIAFNLITFVDITQLGCKMNVNSLCCELLSIWLLLWISHSTLDKYPIVNLVVNCFQFDYFCGYHTACSLSTVFLKLLWIAFNLITFVDITQR